MKTAATTLSDTIGHHTRTGALAPINDTMFGVTSSVHGVSATVQVLPGRAIVDFGRMVPESVPSAPVLRAQVEKYGGAFYASAEQLDGFLREMTAA